MPNRLVLCAILAAGATPVGVSRGDDGASLAPHGERAGPVIRSSAPPSPPCALSPERIDQDRVELRQHGGKASVGPPVCAQGDRPAGWFSPFALSSQRPSRTRLHALHCTWLN